MLKAWALCPNPHAVIFHSACSAGRAYKAYSFLTGAAVQFLPRPELRAIPVPVRVPAAPGLLAASLQFLCYLPKRLPQLPAAVSYRHQTAQNQNRQQALEIQMRVILVIENVSVCFL